MRCQFCLAKLSGEWRNILVALAGSGCWSALSASHAQNLFDLCDFAVKILMSVRSVWSVVKIHLKPLQPPTGFFDVLAVAECAKADK